MKNVLLFDFKLSNYDTLIEDDEDDEEDDDGSDEDGFGDYYEPPGMD